MRSCPICSNTFADEVRTCPHDGVVLIGRKELAVGTVFRGTYRILGVLGRGGMGTVYLAELLLLGEKRALKFLASELAANADAVQRFLREAQKAAKIGLNQPNIVKTLALGQDEDGTFFIEMEYVDGPSLEALMEGAPEGLPVDRAVGIARGIARGLEAAHAKGMVHRDIKPGNVLLALTEDGEEVAKIADFGIVTGAAQETRLTRTGLQPLTAGYASPEQWKGVIPGHLLDGRTDLYALGCVFYEMLTGRVPFDGVNSEELREKHIREMPAAPSTVRAELETYAGLDALVLRMLAKEREARPASARALLRELDGMDWGMAEQEQPFWPGMSDETGWEQPRFVRADRRTDPSHPALSSHPPQPSHSSHPVAHEPDAAGATDADMWDREGMILRTGALTTGEAGSSGQGGEKLGLDQKLFFAGMAIAVVLLVAAYLLHIF